MHSAYVTINKVPTRITTWGKWIEESFDEDEPKDVVLFVTGNPGVTEFYFEFLRTMHEQLGWPVWVIGHAGHERPDTEQFYNIPSLRHNKELYDLEGQISHKIEFVEKYIPQDARVHLIGHSLGAYIATKLLKVASFRAKVVKTYLLFPTLEHIGDTPNGKFFSTIVQRIVPIILFLAWIFTLFPSFIQRFLVLIYALVQRVDRSHIPTICTMIDPKRLGQIFFLAWDEIRKLKGREDDVIRENLKKIKVYFGRSDGWAPVSYCERLRRDFPSVDAEICRRGFSHAFCLSSSRPMGALVADWMKENR